MSLFDGLEQTKNAPDCDPGPAADRLREDIDRRTLEQATRPKGKCHPDVCGKCALSGWRHGTVIRECRHPIVGGDLPYDGKPDCKFRVRDGE